MQRAGAPGFKVAVAQDIQARRDRNCPWDVVQTEDEPLPFVAEPAPPPTEPKQAAHT